MARQKNRTTFREIVASTRRDAARSLFLKAQEASRLAKIARRGRGRLYHLKHIALAEALRIAPDMFRLSIDTQRCIGLDVIRLDAHNALHTHPSWLRDAMNRSA